MTKNSRLRAISVTGIPRPEQLTFEQLDGLRAAVDGEELIGAVRSSRVDRAGKQFLSGSRLADQQDVGIRDGDLPNLQLNGRDGPAGPDNLIEVSLSIEFAAERLIFEIQISEFVKSVELVQQILKQHRLDEIIKRAGFERFDGIFHRGVGRDDEDARMRISLMQLPQQRQPVSVGQLNIADRNVKIRFLGEIHRVAHSPGLADLISLARQQFAERIPNDVLVLDDEDRSLAGHRFAPVSRDSRLTCARTLATSFGSASVLPSRLLITCENSQFQQ